MNDLRDQIARARRRLVTEQFLARLVWCLSAGLAVAVVAVAVPRIPALWRLVPLHAMPLNWDFGWIAGAIGAALVVAGIWTIVSRRSALDAAIEIDRRF